MPQTKAANQFVQKLVGRHSAWIGATKGHAISDKKGGWQGNWTWADYNGLGQITMYTGPMTYSNWDEEQPRYESPSAAVFMNYWEEVCMPPPWGQGHHKRMLLLVCILAIGFGVTLCLVSTISPCVFACVYKQKVTDKRQPIVDFRMPETPTAHGFRSPLCGCFSDANTFWHTFCCFGTRAADTHNAAATEKFWTVIGLWILSMIGGSLIGGESGLGQSIAGGLMAMFMASKRAALRAKLGIAPASCFEDFMLWWCCPLCVVAQEAREVDNAAGVNVQCCCKLMRRNSFSPAGMVGPAVMAGAVMPSQPIVAQIIHIQPPVAGTLAVPQSTGSMISLQPLFQQGA